MEKFEIIFSSLAGTSILLISISFLIFMIKILKDKWGSYGSGIENYNNNILHNWVWFLRKTWAGWLRKFSNLQSKASSPLFRLEKYPRW